MEEAESKRAANLSSIPIKSQISFVDIKRSLRG